MVTALVAIAVGLASLVAGVVVGVRRQRSALGRASATAEQVLRDSRAEAQRMLERSEGEARAYADTYREREEDTLQHRRIEIDATQERLGQREATLEQRGANLAQREAHLIDRESELMEARRLVDEMNEEARAALESLAGVDAKAAKKELMERVEDEARRDAMVLMRDMELKAREESDRRARRILTSTVQRLASEVVAETTVSVVELPNDEMKGRIIGREGRNIRAFEATTGVNIIVDDTPEAVALSCFDPVRREVGRRALERLIEDGRIHPTSIEDAYEKAFAEVEQSVRDAGEWALLEVGLSRVHPELVNLLGRLKYRMSYGQNVLHHLIESAKVASMLAAELGVDAEEARRAAFLHDIGKAVSHALGDPTPWSAPRSPGGSARIRRLFMASRPTTTRSNRGPLRPSSSKRPTLYPQPVPAPAAKRSSPMSAALSLSNLLPCPMRVCSACLLCRLVEKSGL